MKQRCSHDRNERGFTLVELLVVIIILGVLAAIAVFSLTGVPGQAAESACNADARSVQVALSAYYGANNTYPAQGTVILDGSPGAANYTLNDYALTGEGPEAGQTQYMQTYPNNPGANYAIIVGKAYATNGATTSNPAIEDNVAGQVDVQVWTNNGAQVLEEPYNTNNLCNVLGNLSAQSLAAAANLNTNNIVTGGSSPYVTTDGSYLFAVNTQGTVTVTLTNTAGQPVAYQAVTLNQPTPASSTLTLGTTTGTTSATTTTNWLGQAVFQVKDSVAEKLSLQVTASVAGVAAYPIGNVNLQFYGSSTPVGSGGLSGSSVVVSQAPQGVTTVGSAGTGQVTVTISDNAGNPVPGDQISLAATGSATVSPSSATTNVSGQAVFTVSDTAEETVTVTAKDVTNSNLVIGTATMNFFVIPSTTKSSISQSSTSSPLYADGNASTQFTVTLKDASGNAIAGAPVVLGGTLGSAVASPATATTGASGTASFTVTDTKAEAISATATDSFSGVVVGAPGSAATFTTPVVYTGNGGSTISASPTKVFGAGQSTITVNVVDQFSNGRGYSTNPIQGATVSLTAGSGHSVITTVTGTTDANGNASFTVTDTTAETVTYTASVDGASLHTSVTFAPAANAGKSTLVLSNVAKCTNQGACNSSNGYYGTLTVTMNDANGNPVNGDPVTLTLPNGLSLLSGSLTGQTTNSQGIVTWTVRSSSASSTTSSSYTVSVQDSSSPAATVSSSVSI